MASTRADAPNRALLTAEVLEVVLRSATVPRGLALLHRAPVESIAVTLGVRPMEVERARAALESPAQRAVAIAEFSRATARGRGVPAEGERVLVYAG